MSGLFAIWRRELAGLFLTPLAWVLLCVSLLLNGYFFLGFLQDHGGDVDIALQWTYGGAWVFWSVIAFVPPLLTMRMISEESKSGMLEFLLTAPVSDAAVVLGKFLAATTVMAILWSSLLVYALAVQALGTSPDWSAVLGGFAGAIFASALFCGIGMLWSASVSVPLLAAFLAFVSNLVFLLLPFFRSMVPTWLQGVIVRIDVIGHFKGSFLLGVFDTARLVFFLAWTVFFLFLAVRVVEARRWR